MSSLGDLQAEDTIVKLCIDLVAIRIWRSPESSLKYPGLTLIEEVGAAHFLKVSSLLAANSSC
jgi:hypothetical protein